MSQEFNQDVDRNQGYLYTTNAGLSSYLANKRLTDAALGSFGFKDKNVLDVGCGDGTYTFELYDRGGPRAMVGVDPAASAVSLANKKIEKRSIQFVVHSAEKLPFADRSFDLAHLRGVLHHMDNPAAGVQEALRAARTIIIIEPNGYNPVLKAIERLSGYHLKHKERSFAPRQIDNWVKQYGGRVVKRSYAGLVPFFCPVPMARLLKLIEPVVERVPGLRRLVCAVYISVAEAE